MATLGGLAQPPRAFDRILRHTYAVCVHPAKLREGFDVASGRRLAIQLISPVKIDRNTVACLEGIREGSPARGYRPFQRRPCTS